jgi:xylulokinase
MSGDRPGAPTNEDESVDGNLVAGVDCSTQSTKVLIVDTETGTTVAEGRSTHEVSSGDGRSETDPAVWWEALRDALAQTGRAGDVAAIAIGGQQHGLVLQDDGGQPLRPAVRWNDTRSATVVPDLLDGLGGPEAWARAVGSVPVPSFTVTSLAWLRQVEPDVVARASAIRLPHDHLTERLTGRGVTDRGDASGTGWWSPITGTYVDEILELPQVAVDRALLPEVLGPGEAAGEVTSAAAEALGLRPGVTVGAGTGDNMAAALGLGAAPGTPVVSLGTSGTAYVVSGSPTSDPSGVVAGFADADGGYLPLVCTLNCTLAIDRVAEWLGIDRNDAAGSTDCVVLPYLDGERTPDLPLASGTMVGLRHDTTPQAILRAAYEGAVVSLLGGLETMAATGAQVSDDSPIILLGGGARGRSWRDVIGATSGRALLLPDAGELVALGGAVQAAATLAGEPAAAIAKRWGTAEGTVIEPVTRDPAITERVERIRAAVEPALRTRI